MPGHGSSKGSLVQPSSTWPPSRSPCAILVWLEALEGRPTPRFRTIQVCPKEYSASLWQAEGAVNGPAAAQGMGGPDVRRETPRVHHAAWRRGSGLAARGARASVGGAGRRLRLYKPDVQRSVALCKRVPAGPEGNWLYRGAERGGRIPLARRPIRPVAGFGG